MGNHIIRVAGVPKQAKISVLQFDNPDIKDGLLSIESAISRLIPLERDRSAPRGLTSIRVSLTNALQSVGDLLKSPAAPAELPGVGSAEQEARSTSEYLATPTAGMNAAVKVAGF